MKNLPDKICLNFGEITEEEFETDDYNEFCKLDEFAVTFCEDRVYDTDVEYTRTDAFIEKASWWIEENIQKWYENIKVHGFRGMTPLMITGFKKYMKGE